MVAGLGFEPRVSNFNNCCLFHVSKSSQLSLVSLLEDHYRAIAAKNPVHQADLATWLARAEKLPQ